MPDRILKGIDECGSYLGGEFNKQRGFNIFDRVNSRNEVLLEQVGEPVILLKESGVVRTVTALILESNTQGTRLAEDALEQDILAALISI